MTHITESDIENATLTWLSELGYEVLYGPDITPTEDDEPGRERNTHSVVVLKDCLRDTLLPKLISGQMRIEDAERFLRERGIVLTS